MGVIENYRSIWPQPQPVTPPEARFPPPKRHNAELTQAILEKSLTAKHLSAVGLLDGQLPALSSMAIAAAISMLTLLFGWWAFTFRSREYATLA